MSLYAAENLLNALYDRRTSPYPGLAEQHERIDAVKMWQHKELDAYGKRPVNSIEDLPKATQESILKYGYEVFMYFVAEAWQLPPQERSV